MSSENDTATPEEGRRIVSQAELAYIRGCSSNALREFIRNHPDFPVLRRGSNGVAYEFDLDKVLAWYAAHDEAKSEKQRKRQAELDLWRRDFYGEEQTDEDAIKLSPAERKLLADAVRVEDYNRKIRQELIERAPVEAILNEASIRLRKSLLQIPIEFARARGLDRDDRLALERMIRNKLNGLAAELGKAELLEDLVDAAA